MKYLNFKLFNMAYNGINSSSNFAEIKIVGAIFCFLIDLIFTFSVIHLSIHPSTYSFIQFIHFFSIVLLPVLVECEYHVELN